MPELLWTPSEHTVEISNLHAFLKWLDKNKAVHCKDYFSLHKWSTDNIDLFWAFFTEYSSLIHSGSYSKVVDSYNMPGARWFEGMKLNYAENVFEKNYRRPALRLILENNSVLVSPRYKTEYSFDELKSSVAVLADSLKRLGIKRGDHIAGYVSNVPEAIIASLACAAIGAVWSSASPDFSIDAIYDRFSQVRPKLLFASFEYIYGGKKFDNTAKAVELKKKINSIESVVFLPSPMGSAYPDHDYSWNELISENNNTLEYEQLPFDHPMYIMFSSGTTGTPKCIVHGTGGTLIQHRKEHMLHCDLRIGDKLMYFTTTGWMMWNWQVSALASGVTVYLYEGNPAYPRLTSIWDAVKDNNITHFGTSGRYIESCLKYQQNYEPYWLGELNSLRSILYTGSPLSESGFEWIYNNIKKDVHLAGISGGTDIISCFVLGNPVLPVYAGKIQCKGLGIDVAAFDEQGSEVIDTPGELVCRKPIPSMPVYFLNDKEGRKYRDTYFSAFENVWTHGDYIEFDKNGQCIIYGRSDATLNPGGVRIGCAEIYSALDSLDYINGAIAVGWIPPGQSDEIIVLFVTLNNKSELTDEQVIEIKSVIKNVRSPRHAPKYVFTISELPVTRSGKPVELTVKAVLAGKEIKNRSALSNPHILEEVKEIKSKLENLNS